MGNECFSERKKNSNNTFSQGEIGTVEHLFNSLNLADRNSLNPTSLRFLFPENPELADNVCAFIKVNSGKNPLTFDTFKWSLEILTKENSEYQQKRYPELDKADILALVLLGYPSMTRQDLKTLKISNSQAYKYIETILLMARVDEKNDHVNEDAVQTIVNGGLFNKRADWLSFLQYVRTNLPYVNRVIQSYFAYKFLQKNFSRLPTLSQTSNLLDQDFLSIIYLSNVYLHSANQLECLFSSKYNTKTFTQLVTQTLVNYDFPTLVLFKFCSTTKSGVFGAFNLSSWRNDGEYHGNSGCYLFSLTPKFNLYLPNSSGKNYIYMSSSKNQRPGIGFGKTKENRFRLWIDGLEPQHSYVETQDETFSPGSLINDNDDNDNSDDKSSFINVEYVEVWGLSSIMNDVESDALMSEKPWITFNQERLPKLSTKNPKIAETLAGFNSKISSLAKSSNETQEDDIPTWNYRQSSGQNDFPQDLERENKKSSSQLQKNDSYYSKDEGYYNPFTERTEKIMRRGSPS